MKKNKFNGLKGVLIVLFLAVLLIIYFVHLSNKTNEPAEEEVKKLTEVQEVLNRNLTTNYPASPKEVVKYFSEITKCYYDPSLQDNDIVNLGTKMLQIYDDELIAAKPFEMYMADLRSDIAFYNSNGYIISSYSPSPSTDVFYFEEDGYKWARTWCSFTIKSGQNYKTIQEVFILRKDADSHWKIYGWEQVSVDG